MSIIALQKSQSANNVDPSRKLLRNSLLPLFFSFSLCLLFASSRSFCVRFHSLHHHSTEAEREHWMSYTYIFASGRSITLVCRFPHQTLPVTSTDVSICAAHYLSMYTFAYIAISFRDFHIFMWYTVVRLMVCDKCYMCIKPRSSVERRLYRTELSAMLWCNRFKRKYTPETERGYRGSNNTHTHTQAIGKNWKLSSYTMLVSNMDGFSPCVSCFLVDLTCI